MKVLPFKGIFYNQDKIESLADVVSPPYDVIYPELQDELFERSPFNFCQIDLPKETGDERYAVAKDLFKRWSEENIFEQDQKPAIYVHHHSFTTPDGQKVVRKGFFAARRIEDYSDGSIKPHEGTFEGPLSDRLELTRATQVNLSPVFSLYSDPQMNIQNQFERTTQTTPFVDFVSKDGERHQLWKITDPKIIEFVDETLSQKPLFIADGHHRYETALRYKNEIRDNHPDLNENAASNSLLMYFSNMNDQGLFILPIHRAVKNLADLSVSDLLGKLTSFFEIQKVPASEIQKNLEDLKNLGGTHHAFWLLTKDDSESYLLSMDHDKWLDHEFAKELPDCLARLDVSVLHHLIFDKILGLSQDVQDQQENIIYWKSTEKAILETAKGDCDLTFILNSTKIESLEDVCQNGKKMPQKTTFFYPKVVSGLVVHSVNPSDMDGFESN